MFAAVLCCIFWRLVLPLSHSMIHLVQKWSWLYRKVRFRLMTEQGDLLLTQLQYKRTLKYIMKPTHSTLMIKYVSIAVHDENHEPMMVNEADMDFRIPGLPHSVVKHAQSTSVRQLIQKIENHPDQHALQQDLRKIKHTTHLFQKENDSGCLWTSNYVNCSRRTPRRNAKHAHHIGNICIVCCTCGHFLQKETAVNRKFGKYTMDLLSVPEYVIKKGRAHGHRYRKKPGYKTIQSG